MSGWHLLSSTTLVHLLMWMAALKICQKQGVKLRFHKPFFLTPYNPLYLHCQSPCLTLPLSHSLFHPPLLSSLFEHRSCTTLFFTSPPPSLLLFVHHHHIIWFVFLQMYVFSRVVVFFFLSFLSPTCIFQIKFGLSYIGVGRREVIVVLNYIQVIKMCVCVCGGGAGVRQLVWFANQNK